MPRPTLKPEERKEISHVSNVAGLKAAAVGAGIGAVTTYFTRRKSVFFRSLSKPLQSVFVVSAASAGYLFAVDRVATTLENKKLGYADEEMAEIIEYGRIKPRPETTKDKWLQYLNDHRWKIIGGTWAASMIGALGYSFSNKYLNTQQKIVQARMYAQAATIAVLLASAGLSIYAGEPEKKKQLEDEPDAQLRAVLELPVEGNKIKAEEK